MAAIGAIVVLVVIVGCVVACVAVSRAVNRVQVARRNEFESAAEHFDAYETMLPGDERALLADYRQLKQIEQDREQALYDGGGW